MKLLRWLRIFRVKCVKDASSGLYVTLYDIESSGLHYGQREHNFLLALSHHETSGEKSKFDWFENFPFTFLDRYWQG